MHESLKFPFIVDFGSEQKVEVMKTRVLDSFLHRLFKFINGRTNLIASYDLIDFNDFKLRDESNSSNECIGIVVQGPVIPKITKLSIDFLNILFPAAKIVLSTWQNENVNPFYHDEYSTMKLLINQKPNDPGFSNINLQILSSKSGIDYLATQGCTHILKIRSDVLITNPNSLDRLLQFHQVNQSGIVFSSFNTFLNRLYSVSDQLMFGSVDQLKTFWSANLVSSNQEYEVAESYLFRNYLFQLGFTPENTLASYLQAISKYTIIIDHESLGQIWNKGTFTSLSKRWRDYNDDSKLKQICAQDWIAIRNDLNNFMQEKKILLYKPIN